MAAYKQTLSNLPLSPLSLTDRVPYVPGLGTRVLWSSVCQGDGNSNIEARNSKQIRISNVKNSKHPTQKIRFWSFEIRILVIVSDFDIRISDFCCRLSRDIPCVQQADLWVRIRLYRVRRGPEIFLLKLSNKRN